MRRMNKHISNTGRIIVDSLMILLLLGLLAIPASSVSLLHVGTTGVQQTQVLSSNDTRVEQKDVNEDQVLESTMSIRVQDDNSMEGMDLGQTGQ